MPAFPSEILMLVFSFLSRPDLLKAIRVSKHWCSIAIRILWRNCHFPRLYSPWYYAHLFKTYGQFVRHVEFKGWRPSVGVEVKLVVETCSNITSVCFFIGRDMWGIDMLCKDLSDRLESFQIHSGLVPIEPSLLGVYISKLWKLKRLDVSYVGNFDDASCQQIVAKCQLLEDLNFKNSNITDDSVQLVAQHLQHIRILNLSRCRKITDESIFAIAKSCPSLTSLDVEGTQITDNALVAFTSTRIRVLSISECKMITEKSLTAIAKSCPLLESLNISKCETITDDSLTAIAESCPLLVSLDVRHTQITDNALVALATARCRETITSLDLTGCNRITHTGLRQVVDSFTRLRHFNIRCYKPLTDELDELCIGLLNVEETQITDDALVAFTSTHIRVLSISECNMITDKSLTAITKSCPLLKSLDISSCEMITDDSLTAIAKSCSLLTSLSVKYTQITDNALVALATARCRETITSLDLAGCNRITHTGLRQVVDNFTRLRHLNIRSYNTQTNELNELCIGLLNVGQAQITDDALVAFTSTHIRVLSISECNMITDKLLTTIAKSC
jgi:Leucine-rich repeat (LRR) protein